MPVPGYISLRPIDVPVAKRTAIEVDDSFKADSNPSPSPTGSAKKGDASFRSQRAKFFSTLSKDNLRRISTEFLTNAQQMALTMELSGEELDKADEEALLEGIKASLPDMKSDPSSGRLQKRARIDVPGGDLQGSQLKKPVDQQLVPTTSDSVLNPALPAFPKLDWERAMRVTGSQPWHIEHQRNARCGQHAVNAILNQPYFTENRAIHCIETEFGQGALALKDKEGKPLYPVSDAHGNYSADVLCAVLNMALQDFKQHKLTDPANPRIPQNYSVLWKNKKREGEHVINPAWSKLFDELMPMTPSALPKTNAFIIATGGHYIGCRWIDGHWRNLDSINNYKNFLDLEERRIPDIKKFIESKGAIGVIMDGEFVKKHASVS